MKPEFINPFLLAATEVLESELQAEVDRGDLSTRKASATAQEVTIMVGVTGDVQGAVFYGMSQRTACQMISAMMGKRLPVFDELVESGVAEMGNVITGRATIGLEKAGYVCTLTPPTVIVGRGVIISTVEIGQINVGFQTQYGDMEIGVALREKVG